ncbi:MULTISPECIES: co-chaperone YbbN [unclassified Haloferax]|uniref:thioredoxin family protein n=1 Tax=unclassified Haloferax TaxID=2625095 RepID=UPI000E24E6B9|nr:MULTISPECIES: thioredoxin family protein [unclassified Haloferax]RDZ37378.1 thioredoxin [Haloferax sp. Atlit-24N]RLM38174.1 thioredoxin [Haloferax sp. Atlit-109R]RLM46116.1 thioredoxin [Haloferax sp. Atlit-105R]
MAATDIDADPETALETLIAAGAVDEAPDGTLSTTAEFEKTLAVYHDIYGAVSTEEFHRTVSELFGVAPENVEARLDEFGVTRADVVAYLAAKSFLDAPVGQDLLLVMAGLLVEITPSSPVPDALDEFDDDSFESYLAAHPDAVVLVWRRFCEPCDAMKADLDAILDRVPDGVAAAGVDGEAADEFCRRFDVDSAPTLLCVRDGELRERASGRQTPAEVAAVLDRVY